jgi:hypothetical protein
MTIILATNINKAARLYNWAAQKLLMQSKNEKTRKNIAVIPGLFLHLR